MIVGKDGLPLHDPLGTTVNTIRWKHTEVIRSMPERWIEADTLEQMSWIDSLEDFVQRAIPFRRYLNEEIISAQEIIRKLDEIIQSRTK